MSLNGSPAKGCELEELSLCFNYQHIKNKVPTHKINLHAIANIAGSNPTGDINVSSYECCLFEGTHLCDGSIKVQKRCTERVFVCVCVCVCNCAPVCIMLNNKILHLQWLGRRGQTKKERKTYNQAIKQYPYILA